MTKIDNEQKLKDLLNNPKKYDMDTKRNFLKNSTPKENKIL